MSTAFEGRCLLITGGTGSFGNAMARYALAHGVREIRILSRDEAKQDAMRLAYQDPRLKLYIGNVRDPRSLEAPANGADLVFHAAALKQVPSCEFFPEEAVRTNVLGSANVIDAATSAGAEAVVLLSTDKAVAPVNAMGMTKALMEKTMQAAARARRSPSATRVCAVRYGNVMYSRGSVIPAFVDSVRRKLPMRITDPDMTRFLLPLPVAVELVEAAVREAEPGDVLIRKAPAATVGTLARAVAELFDAPPNIERIGIRHGEKLHETLATGEELARSVEEPTHWRVRMDDRDLNYAIYTSEGEAAPRHADYTSASTEQLDVQQVKDLLLTLPEIRTLVESN